MNYVFDLYGTLINIWTNEEKSELWSGVAAFLGESGDSGEKIRLEYLSLCKEREAGEFHEIDLLSVFRELLSRRGLDENDAQRLATEFRRLSMVRIKKFFGVVGMLKAIKNQGGVYLLSNAQSCFTVDELKSTGLFDYFDGILISSDVGVKKPSPEIFKIAFETFGISAENSVYIGNDLHDDILGATGVGMKTVYIETPQSRKYENGPKPTYTVKNHFEMKELLLSL